jgi:hypothetical protein
VELWSRTWVVAELAVVALVGMVAVAGVLAVVADLTLGTGVPARRGGAGGVAAGVGAQWQRTLQLLRYY